MLVESSHMYNLKDEELNDWTEPTKCDLETGMLLLLFCKVHLRVEEVLRDSRPQA